MCLSAFRRLSRQLTSTNAAAGMLWQNVLGHDAFPHRIQLMASRVFLLYPCAASAPVEADRATLTAIRTAGPEKAAATLLSTANSSANVTAAAGAAVNQAASSNASALAKVVISAATENPVAFGKVLSSATVNAAASGRTGALATATVAAFASATATQGKAVSQAWAQVRPTAVPFGQFVISCAYAEGCFLECCGFAWKMENVLQVGCPCTPGYCNLRHSPSAAKIGLTCIARLHNCGHICV
jgi:hypothetical protein